jgi:ParB family chromosome partitioning protein
MSSSKKDKPKHLGRGLQSLLGPIKAGDEDLKKPLPIVPFSSNFPPDKGLQESFREIPLDKLSPNPYQPRTDWNDKELSELAESIRVSGVIQPIVARKAGDGYEIIAGERRVRASKLAGLDKIPTIVRAASDEQLLELALIENIHRSNLSPIERAKAYQNYLKTFSLTQIEAGERLGEDRSMVANYMRLLDLPPDVQKMVAGGDLSMGHARAILALPTDELRRKLANRAYSGRLNVREVERLVRKHLGEGPNPQRRVVYKPAHIVDLENKLTNHLGTRVTIDAKKKGHRGKIMIEYYSLEDFDRITEQLGLETLEEV